MISVDSRLQERARVVPPVGPRMVGPYEVLRCVQSRDDVELYEARVPEGARVALKWARPGGGPALRAALEHEATLLRWLDGEVAPYFIDMDVHEGRPYLVMEWCAGTSLAALAGEGREATLRGCEAVLDAYARLHARGVLHGDVHPANILLTPEGEVRVREYRHACVPGRLTPRDTSWRWAAGLFLEPESARVLLARQPVPPPTLAGEQYALAALVYLLLHGRAPLELSLDADTLLRTVAEAPPLPFSHRGGEAWPTVEAVLARALAKDPAQRFPSVAEFARALRACHFLKER